ncbi:hypothetical protein H8N00_02555 [Streptomyces sp. AC563]|uniref:DUF732 domain-containing protein n=1 Tax=Streptomyces buecherae TaxID=2763006 RepID=UPI00164D8C2B|nr:DUF732 domain-containing protein [Streptomyces buecherae]MBC3987805.1 hypothetical protein [Streptomyces buecherae]
MRKAAKIGIGVAGGLIVIGAVSSAFGDDSDDNADSTKPTPTATRTVSETGKPADNPSTEAPKPTSGIPSPDATQQAALIQGLRAIEPGLVAKEERAVSRARSVCLDLKADKPAATVQNNARQRYEGGTVPHISDDQAARIVEVVKASFCR